MKLVSNYRLGVYFSRYCFDIMPKCWTCIPFLSRLMEYFGVKQDHLPAIYSFKRGEGKVALFEGVFEAIKLEQFLKNDALQNHV